MSGEEDAFPPTAAAALRSLRLALKATRAADAASAHPLGAASVGAARAALSTSLRGLRGAAEATVLAAATPEGDRVATVQEDAARRGEHVTAVRDALAECRDHARRMDPFAPAHSVVMHRVKGAAEAVGAQAVENLGGDSALPSENNAQSRGGSDGVPGPLLTVCSTTFLADFQFYPNDVSVSFRHLASNSFQEISDKEIDADFERLVRAERFVELHVAFNVLVKQEALDKAMRPTIQLKDALRCFEDDVLAMQAAERATVPGLPDSEYRDKGIGSVQRSAHGLRIAFAKDWHAFLGVEDAYPPRPIVASQTNPVARPDSMQLPVAFDFTPSRPLVTVGAQYVLTLLQPLVATTTFAATLERSCASVSALDPRGMLNEAIGVKFEDGLAPSGGQIPQNGTSQVGLLDRGSGPGLQGSGSTAPSRPAVAVAYRSNSASTLSPLRTSGSYRGARPTLEGLLAPSVLGMSKNEPTDSSSGTYFEIDGLSGEGEVFTRAALPGKKYFKFSYCRNEAVPGVYVHRIPVASPQNIPGVLKVLRQQLVFNALFSSCFSTASYVESDSHAVIEQPIEVVVSNAPRFMHFSVYDDVEDGVLGIGVSIGLDGVIDARLRGPKGKPAACSNAKASALLRAAYNVPLAINAIRGIEERSRSTASMPDGGTATLNAAGLPMDGVSVGDAIMSEIGLAAVGGASA